MRRSAALAPLSRDHHHALVVARELTRARAHHLTAAAESFVTFLAGHELAHFDFEEALLLPALPSGEPGATLARRVREDHEWLRGAMRSLQQAPEAASAEALQEIGARLRDHVKLEEQELFPYLERSLDPPVLDRIGAQLAARA